MGDRGESAGGSTGGRGFSSGDPELSGLLREGKYVGPVVVIVGATGSGKTGAAIQLALTSAIPGEVISADSRAIYKVMDIGTAKPSIDERQGVPHFGFDLVEPGERFTVADWKEYAEQKICSIRKRGHLPIVAGGTGLYVDALVFDYQFSREGKKVVQDADGGYPDRKKMSSEYLVFGIKWEPEELRSRLRERVNKLFVQELFEETERLVSLYGWGSQAMTSDIYRYAWGYLQGEYSLERAKELCFYEDWHLAKRQMTWFRRNSEIEWCRLEDLDTKIKLLLAECGGDVVK